MNPVPDGAMTYKKAVSRSMRVEDSGARWEADRREARFGDGGSCHHDGP